MRYQQKGIIWYHCIMVVLPKTWKWLSSVLHTTYSYIHAHIIRNIHTQIHTFSMHIYTYMNTRREPLHVQYFFKSLFFHNNLSIKIIWNTRFELIVISYFEWHVLKNAIGYIKINHWTRSAHVTRLIACQNCKTGSNNLSFTKSPIYVKLQLVIDIDLP